MLIIRGELLNVRTATFKDDKGGEKTAHYAQLLTNFPSSGSGFGDEVKLPDGIDPEKMREQIGFVLHFAVRAFVAKNGKLYLSMMNPQPEGIFQVFELDGNEPADASA
jgi:hypothetical protein